MEVDMKSLLIEEFKDDPLLTEIKINKLEDELYTEPVLQMHPNTTYSTIEAARIIGRNDSTIRNYFRTDLIDYIGPERLGKQYRLNYRSIFKLKMILTLVEKANKTSADLAYYVGIKPLMSTGSFNTEKSISTRSENEILNEISNMKKMLLLHNLKLTINEEEIKLGKLKQDYRNIEHEIEMLKKELELKKLEKQNNRIEKKYYKILDYSLRKTTQENSKTEKRGLLGAIFGTSKKEPIDIDSILEDALKQSEKEIEKISDFDEQIKKLEVKIIEKEKRKNEYLNEINKQETKIKTIALNTANLNNNSAINESLHQDIDRMNSDNKESE